MRTLRVAIVGAAATLALPYTATPANRFPTPQPLASAPMANPDCRDPWAGTAWEGYCAEKMHAWDRDCWAELRPGPGCRELAGHCTGAVRDCLTPLGRMILGIFGRGGRDDAGWSDAPAADSGAATGAKGSTQEPPVAPLPPSPSPPREEVAPLPPAADTIQPEPVPSATDEKSWPVAPDPPTNPLPKRTAPETLAPDVQRDTDGEGISPPYPPLIPENVLPRKAPPPDPPREPNETFDDDSRGIPQTQVRHDLYDQVTRGGTTSQPKRPAAARIVLEIR